MKMKGLDFISCGLSDIKSAEKKREYNTAFICFVEDHKSPCTFSPFLSKPPGLYCNKLPSRKQLNHFCRADSSYTRGIFFSLFIQTSRKFRHTFILLYFSYYPVPFHNFFSLFHCPIGIHSAAFARTPQFFIPGKLGRCRSSYYVYFYCAKPRNPISIFYSVIPSAPWGLPQHLNFSQNSFGVKSSRTTNLYKPLELPKAFRNWSMESESPNNLLN